MQNPTMARAWPTDQRLGRRGQLQAYKQDGYMPHIQVVYCYFGHFADKQTPIISPQITYWEETGQLFHVEYTDQA